MEEREIFVNQVREVMKMVGHVVIKVVTTTPPGPHRMKAVDAQLWNIIDRCEKEGYTHNVASVGVKRGLEAAMVLLMAT